MVKRFHLLDAQIGFLRVGFKWSVETGKNKLVLCHILHPSHEMQPTVFYFLAIPSSNAFYGMKNISVAGPTFC